MINLTLVIEKFALLAELDAAEASKWKTFISACVQALEARLPENADISGSMALLATAAASDAFYRYCLLDIGKGDVMSTVGSVTVKKDAKAQLAAASSFRTEAFTSVRHLLRDDGFVFTGV